MKKSTDLRVSVVIPNFNGHSLLVDNLPSVIAAAGDSKNKIVEIIVVDDASVDDSVELLKSKFPSVKIVQHKVNRGFAESVNTGARTARGSLLCLLNSDVVPEKDFLQPVLPHFRKPEVFAVSLHEKKYGWAKGKYDKGFIVHGAGEESESVHESFWANGGSAVFRRSMWMKLGGMDTDLFKFYWEDVDLSYRAQKRGWVVLWEPKAKVVHDHESSTRKVFSRQQKLRMQETNQLLFIWKNLTSQHLFRKHVAGLIHRIVGHPGYVRIFLTALPKLGVVLDKRRKERREAKVSDEAIFAKF